MKDATMKYQKTINVYDGDTLKRLHDGSLTLQAGQWIMCGSGPKSRYCGRTATGTLVAEHSTSFKHFKIALDYWKSRQN